MEAAAATYVGELKPMAKRVKQFLSDSKTSMASLADEINYSRTTVSRYLNGTYGSNAEELESALFKYLTDKTKNTDFGNAPIQKRSGLFASKDANQIMGVCQSCQTYSGLGIIVGKSGFGKTFTLKEYAKFPRVGYIECDDAMSNRDLVEAIEGALGLPSFYQSIWSRVNKIRHFCSMNDGYLIIIDEADKLISKYCQKKMEILRGIFDQTNVGIIIAGEPRLESQIKGYLPRMANRVDFYVSLKGLSDSEVENFLNGYEIEEDALKELKARSCNPQTGCFRLLDRTLDNVFRILLGNGETIITLKVIEQASRMMML